MGLLRGDGELSEAEKNGLRSFSSDLTGCCVSEWQRRRVRRRQGWQGQRETVEKTGTKDQGIWKQTYSEWKAGGRRVTLFFFFFVQLAAQTSSLHMFSCTRQNWNPVFKTLIRLTEFLPMMQFFLHPFFSCLQATTTGSGTDFNWKEARKVQALSNNNLNGWLSLNHCTPRGGEHNLAFKCHSYWRKTQPSTAPLND